MARIHQVCDADCKFTTGKLSNVTKELPECGALDVPLPVVARFDKLKVPLRVKDVGGYGGENLFEGQVCSHGREYGRGLVLGTAVSRVWPAAPVPGPYRRPPFEGQVAGIHRA